MFSSEQKFNVNGSSRENFQKTLQLALELDSVASKIRLPEYYQVDTEKGELYLVSSYSRLENTLPFPPKASLETIISIIWDHLLSAEFQSVLHSKTTDDIDGTIDAGWEIFIPRYPVENAWQLFVGVRLDWIYYAK